ncbi:MAG: hypothetical protein KY445_16340 [Armatimonadetes bacterium]|nr:hypothetical protein [Armatimonadota bacterium]
MNVRNLIPAALLGALGSAGSISAPAFPTISPFKRKNNPTKNSRTIGFPRSPFKASRIVGADGIGLSARQRRNMKRAQGGAR